MKKILALLSACLLLGALSACGGQPNLKPIANSSAVETTPETTDANAFRYAGKALPKGWTKLEEYGTSSYLEAVYGKGDNAPTLSVSVFHYDDTHGYGKAKALAEAVHAREKKSSAVGTRQIGGVEFYYLSFPSPENEKLLRYEFYGQTEPDSENNYQFYMIVLDKLTDAEQFDALQDVLDCVDFSESE